MAGDEHSCANSRAASVVRVASLTMLSELLLAQSGHRQTWRSHCQPPGPSKEQCCQPSSLGTPRGKTRSTELRWEPQACRRAWCPPEACTAAAQARSSRGLRNAALPPDAASVTQPKPHRPHTLHLLVRPGLSVARPRRRRVGARCEPRLVQLSSGRSSGRRSCGWVRGCCI